MKPEGKNGRAADGKGRGGRGGRGHYAGETYILGVSDGRVLGCVRFYRLRLVVLLFVLSMFLEGIQFFRDVCLWTLWRFYFAPHTLGA